MSTPEPSKQRLIRVCYCSPNLVQDRCDYCMAKLEVSRLLDIPIEDFPNGMNEREKEIDETFNYYNISGTARLNIIMDLGDREEV